MLHPAKAKPPSMELAPVRQAPSDMHTLKTALLALHGLQHRWGSLPSAAQKEYAELLGCMHDKLRMLLGDEAPGNNGAAQPVDDGGWTAV